MHTYFYNLYFAKTENDSAIQVFGVATKYYNK